MMVGGGEVSFPRWRKDKEPLSPHIITFELIVFEIFLIAMFRNLHPVFLCEIKQLTLLLLYDIKSSYFVGVSIFTIYWCILKYNQKRDLRTSHFKFCFAI